MVLPVPTRLLLIALSLLGGDYLLWSWATDGNSDTLALISGVALVPLILLVLWLFALGVAKALIARPMKGAIGGSPARLRTRNRLASTDQGAATAASSINARSSEKIAA